jgi:tRNA A37 threonylcarbamoyladenosine synthetase subunit TsaC/SUA5/YrdC
MASRAILVSEPVTLFLKDGMQVVTFVDETTKSYHVICDLWGEDLSLVLPHRLESQRTASKEKQSQVHCPVEMLT